MSEKRPYNGWNAVLVIKYEVVNQEMVLAALKSEPMTAYVEAVMVPSKPERKTLEKMADTACQSRFVEVHMMYRSQSK